MSRADERDVAPILDLSVIAGLRELGGEQDPGLLSELVELFLEDAPTYLQEIATGLDSNDMERVLRASHTLKSSSASMGAAGLSGLARSIEAGAKSGDLDLLQQLQGVMREVYPQTVAALQELQP